MIIKCITFYLYCKSLRKIYCSIYPSLCTIFVSSNSSLSWCRRNLCCVSPTLDRPSLTCCPTRISFAWFRKLTPPPKSRKLWKSSSSARERSTTILLRSGTLWVSWRERSNLIVCFDWCFYLAWKLTGHLFLFISSTLSTRTRLLSFSMYTYHISLHHDIVNITHQSTSLTSGLSSDIAISRLEQICPFPYDCVIAELAKYPNAKVSWVQEEHKNMGAWSYVQPRFETAAEHKFKISYAGRNVSPSPATGWKEPSKR